MEVGVFSLSLTKTSSSSALCSGSCDECSSSCLSERTFLVYFTVNMLYKSSERFQKGLHVMIPSNETDTVPPLTDTGCLKKLFPLCFFVNFSAPFTPNNQNNKVSEKPIQCADQSCQKFYFKVKN